MSFGAQVLILEKNQYPLHKNKVIIVLKSLTPEEIRQLDKFVRSPIHNQHDDVIRLFQYLRKNLTNGGRALDKERVFGNLFPDLDFDMQQIHYLSSYLLKVVETFLAWQEWRKDETDYQLSLLRALRHHRLEAQFERTFTKASQIINEKKQLDTTSLYHDYQLEMERFNQDRLRTGKQVFRLQEMSDLLDAYFVAEKLRNACILLSNQSISASSYETGLLNAVLNFINGQKLLEHPLVAIYYHSYRTLETKKNNESFKALKSLLNLHRKSFNINELHDVYIFAVNYCIRQLNSGDQGFMSEVFDIYQLGLETDAFVQNGIMTPRTYSNIIMSGLKLSEYKWVEKFILEYKNALPEKHREGFFNYNLARLYYEQKNYAAAMPLLSQMEYEDVLLTSLGKVLLSKMQFEQGEYDSLTSLLSSFRIYIQRKKMPGSHHESHLNFIHFLSKLLYPFSGSQEKIIHEIIETKLVAEKDWLLEQVKKL